MNTDCRESNPRGRRIAAAASALVQGGIWGDAVRRFASILFRSSEVISIRLDRERHWRALDRLSDHTLKDIGLARAHTDRGWKQLL